MATYHGFKSVEDAEFYDKLYSVVLKDKFDIVDFGEKVSIPAHHGDTIYWNKVIPMDLPKGKIVEGITPESNKFQIAKFKASTAQYGDYIKLTDLVTLLSKDPVMQVAVEELGTTSSAFFNKLVLEELYKTTNVYYAGNKTLDTIVGTDTITMDDLNRIRTILRRNKVQPYEDGKYVLLIDPDVEYDLKQLAEVNKSWIDVAKYANPSSILRGEIGSIYGFKVVVKDYIEKVTIETLGGQEENKTTSLTRCLVFGKDERGGKGFGTVDIAGSKANRPSIIYKGLGSAGSDDPLDQRQTVGWKVNGFGTRILDPRLVMEFLVPVSMPTTKMSDDLIFNTAVGFVAKAPNPLEKNTPVTFYDITTD